MNIPFYIRVWWELYIEIFNLPQNLHSFHLIHEKLGSTLSLSLFLLFSSTSHGILITLISTCVVSPVNSRFFESVLDWTEEDEPTYKTTSFRMSESYIRYYRFHEQ